LAGGRINKKTATSKRGRNDVAVFLMKGTFWGMFFVGVGFGGNSRELSIPHNSNLVKQHALK